MASTTPAADADLIIMEELALELAAETGTPVAECRAALLAERGSRSVADDEPPGPSASGETHALVSFRAAPTDVREYEFCELELEGKRVAHRASRNTSRGILAVRNARADEFLPRARAMQCAGDLEGALGLFLQATDVPGGLWGRPKLRHKIEALERKVSGAVRETEVVHAAPREPAPETTPPIVGAHLAGH